MLRAIALAFIDMCRGKPFPDLKYVQRAIKGLSILLTNTDERVLSNSGWAIASLCDVKDAQQIQAIKSSGALDRLITLLDHQSDLVRQPALRAMGHIMGNSLEVMQYLIDVGVLQQFHRMLIMGPTSTGTTLVKQEVCRAISKMTAGSEKQIQAVISNHLLPSLVIILEEKSYENTKQALCAIANALSGANHAQLERICEIGTLVHFKRHLENAPENERDFVRNSSEIVSRAEQRMILLLSGYSRLNSMINDHLPNDVLGVIMWFATAAGSKLDFCLQINGENIMDEPKEARGDASSPNTEQTQADAKSEWNGVDFPSLTMIVIFLMCGVGIQYFRRKYI